MPFFLLLNSYLAIIFNFDTIEASNYAYYKNSISMGRLGFEPRTNRLKAEYSTVELATHHVFMSPLL